MSNTKKQLSLSVLSLVLCIAMLLGTTYAWFTDSVTSGKNKIIAGNLDIEMYWTDDYEKAEAGTGEWYNVEDPQYNAIFDYDLWEPGYTEVRYIKVKNAGNLALKYAINMFANGEIGDLAEVINVYYIEDPLSAEVTRTAVNTMAPAGVLTDLFTKFPVVEEYLDKDSEHIFGIALKMQESAGNEYQGKSVGDSFSVMVRATQATAELDSFGDDYDENAYFPEITVTETKTVTVSGNAVSAPVVLGGKADDDAKAEVPAGVKLADGVSELTFTVSPMKNSGANIESADEITRKSLDVHIEGIASDNTTPIIVTLDNYLMRNLNSTSVKLYHVENGQTKEMTHVASEAELTKHNTFTYDARTGNVKMALCSFSEILITADESDPWDGTVGTMPAEVGGVYTINTAEQLAAFAKAVNDGNDFSGKTVKLGKTIVLNDWKVDDSHDYTAKQLGDYNDPAFEQNGKLFHKFTPIGKGSNLSNETAANDLKPFRGTFDGCGYAVSGLFNLWYDDPAEWSSQIGLFGCVENATIKNLTIRDSFVYTYGGMVGLVSSFVGGNTTFENITIQDNFVTAYNNYLGGVVGVVFDHDSINARVSFNNCYVDNTNKFEALWGTYDAPIGGIAGGAYANSDVTFTDCTVFPEMSLYNDCCANYQWFAYRYSGMLIGYVRAGDRANYLANKVHCSNVTVKYGEWTDQYYCELEAAGKGSYNEPDEWKYVRIEKDQVDVVEKSCKNTGHDHANHPDEDHIATNITFKQLFGGGQGVYGEETHSGVEIVENCGSIVKAFPNTDKYLYRVGNMNTVALGSLFKAESGTVIKSSAVKLTAEKIAGVSSVDYKANTTDWTNGTLQFSGTGVVKLTLSYLTQEPIELNLEVVDAKNVTAMESPSSSNIVLLNDVNSTGFSISNGKTLFGNGFKITDTLSDTTDSAGWITVVNGNFDNVQIIGKEYSSFSLTKGSANFRPGVRITGPCNIYNSYISGRSQAVLITADKSDVCFENTTIQGGSVANIEISKANSVTFDNLTTVQPGTTGSYGIGILVDTDECPMYLKGDLKQYNWAEKSVIPSTYSSALSDIYSNSNYAKYRYVNNDKTYINLGIFFFNASGSLSADQAKNNDNRDNKSTIKYSDVSKSSLGYTATIYTYECNGSVAQDRFLYPGYSCFEQHPIIPTVSITYPNQFVSEDEPYCYGSDGKINIGGFASGENFEWKPQILNISKDNKAISYTTQIRKIGDNAFTDCSSGSFKFTEEGEYELKFSYSDSENYRLRNGAPEKHTVEYTKTLQIRVNLKSESKQYATYTFKDKSNNTYSSTTKAITCNGSTVLYVMPNVSTTEPNKIGSLTINGETIYYPIVDGAATSANNAYRYCYVFTGVTITDKSKTLDTSITSQPDNFSFVGWNLGANLTLQDGTSVTKVLTSNKDVKFEKYNSKLTYRQTFNAGTAAYDAAQVITEYEYTDEEGRTCRYFIGNDIPATVKYSGCVASGTLITLADGTQKPIEDITYEDKLLVWDFFTGEYAEKDISILVYHGDENYQVVNSEYSDGTVLRTIAEHGVFDYDLNKYVYLTPENCTDYIGHRFVKYNANGGYDLVTMTNAFVTEEYTGAYSLTSSGVSNAFAENLLTVAPPDDFYNWIEMDGKLHYNVEKFYSDIEKYGTYDYDVFKDYVTYEQYVAFNGAYLKSAVEQGKFTFDYIIQLIEEYSQYMPE